MGKEYTTPGVSASAIPKELRARGQWVCYRLIQRPGKARTDKVPFDPRTGSRASTTDSLTWAPFEEAARRAKDYEGVGFVFGSGDPYVGIDLDHCRDPETGEIEEWAQEIIKDFDSYTEASPSGTGVHVIGRGGHPGGEALHKRGGVECYSERRFFTITGGVIGEAPEEIPECQAATDRLCTRYLVPDEPKTNGRAAELSDEEIIALCRRASNADKFAALYDHGDATGYGGDLNRVDMALIGHLRFYTQDPDQIDRIMRSSALRRPKWETKRVGKTWLRYSIDNSLRKGGERYTPRTPRAEGKAKTEKKPSPNGNGSEADPDQDRGENDQKPADEPSFNLTDLGNAERLVARHGRDLRYVYPWSKWLAWDGTRWKPDDGGEIESLARDTVRAIYAEAENAEDSGERKAIARHAAASESRSRIDAMIALAHSMVKASPEELDTDLWLLNCKNGTIDLRTGKLRAHSREDLITKLAPVEYDGGAACPTFEGFLRHIVPSEKLRGFVQRLFGYALTGDVSEQVLPFLYGSGANGKSTLVNTALEVAGDYGLQAADDLLLAKRGTHPTELTDLFGARIAASVEVEDGRRLAEALIKKLTGGERIRARRMREDFWEFDPTHKVLLVANHKPTIRGRDRAIWRRIKLIPFEVEIPEAEQDKKLPEKLRTELPGILAWAVRGCLAWQHGGLAEPPEVRDATEEYRQEQDVLAAWIKDRCIVLHDTYQKLSDLYESYHGWCSESNETAETKRKFGDRLTESGFEADNGTGNVAIRRGIALRHDGDPDPHRVNEPDPPEPPEDPKQPPETPDEGEELINEGDAKDGRNPDTYAESENRVNERYPEMTITDKKISTGGLYTNPVNSVNSLTPAPKRRLTVEEAERVQRLVSEGMSARLARAEVLGEKPV